VRLVSALVTCASLALVVACGVPESSDVRPIDPADVPFGLNETTTTTTTTTLAPTTTRPLPETTVADATTTTTAALESTTTVAPVEPVTLFFLTGREVVPTQRSLLSPATPPQVLAALASGPPTGDEAAGLRTALPADMEMLVQVEAGVATVDLPPTFIEDVPGSEQRLAIAQIVLTLTRRGGVGQVRFTLGGEPQQVPRGQGDITSPGGAVSCDDYENLLARGFSC
jgi:spore germination protein GerM